jgi:methylglutaconyl-CoA hydratase
VLSAGPAAARAAKAVIRELRGLSADQARSLTVQRIATQRTSAEGQEGLSAFLEKRQPAWLD